MTISIGTLIGLLAIWPMAVILAFWLFDEFRLRKRPFVPSKKEMVVCEICLHKFFCDKDSIINKCPQCGSLNKR